MAVNIQEAIKDWVVSPPHAYIKLKKTLEDPRSSFKEFSAIIGNDPALTARLLKIVNSPFYGLECEVDTITHALGIIGTEQLTQLVLATSVTEQFPNIPERLVSMDLFWKHSIACGVTAKIIAAWHGESNLESYYLAGMLHDIGSLIIYKKFPEEAEKVLGRCKNKKEIYSMSSGKFLAPAMPKWAEHCLKAGVCPHYSMNRCIIITDLKKRKTAL